jgi:hypothetical protein
LNAEMAGSAGSAVNWGKLTQESAQAQEFMAGANYKTAASFKAATAEQRAASVALLDVEKASGRAGQSMVRQMREARFDIMLAVGAVYALAKAWEAAATAEAASRHLSGQVGPTISKEIGDAAKALNFTPDQYQTLALPLKIAGIHANNLKEMVIRIGEASRASGVPVEALEKMIEKVQTGGHATWDDMKTLVTVDKDAQHLADTFRTMSVNQSEYERKFKEVSEANRRVIQQREEKIAGQDAFAEKIGVGESSFKAYIARGGRGQGLVDQLAASKEQFRPRSYAELWGQTPEKGLAAAEDKRYSEGIAQLAKEGDSTRSAVLNYIKAGKFDRSDVMSAAGRSRTEAEQGRLSDERKVQEKESRDYEKSQRDILTKGVNEFLLKLTPAKEAERKAEVEKQKATPEGEAQHVTAVVKDMSVTAGNMVVHYANAYVTMQPVQDLAGAVQNALPNAARDQVRSRLKQGGLDYDTIIPAPAVVDQRAMVYQVESRLGHAVPGRVPGPTPKEGSKVEDTTTHGLLEQLLKLFSGT